MVNLENKPMPMRLNGEITVDHDGTVYGGNGFLRLVQVMPEDDLAFIQTYSPYVDEYKTEPDQEFVLSLGRCGDGAVIVYGTSTDNGTGDTVLGLQ